VREILHCWNSHTFEPIHTFLQLREAECMLTYYIRKYSARSTVSGSSEVTPPMQSKDYESRSTYSTHKSLACCFIEPASRSTHFAPTAEETP